MKRPVLIILSVVVAFVLVGSLLMNLFGLQVGRTFSYVSSELPGYGGGAPEFESPQESFTSAPIPASDQVSVQMEGMDPSKAQALQERMVIQTHVKGFVDNPRDFHPSRFMRVVKKTPR